MKILNLVLTREWYDKIASGAKAHEYREIKPYWMNRLTRIAGGIKTKWTGQECKLIAGGAIGIPKEWWEKFTHVTFMRAYTSTKMTFRIKSFSIDTTPRNDLGEPCIDIELGERTA